MEEVRDDPLVLHILADPRVAPQVRLHIQIAASRSMLVPREYAIYDRPLRALSCKVDYRLQVSLIRRTYISTGDIQGYFPREPIILDPGEWVILLGKFYLMVTAVATLSLHDLQRKALPVPDVVLEEHGSHRHDSRSHLLQDIGACYQQANVRSSV